MNLLLENHESYPIKDRKQLNVALLSGGEVVLNMLYDVPLHTARLESGSARRMFMVYKEGKRFPKHVFKNEYGFDVGMIDPQAAYNDYGCIQLYGNAFYYNLGFIKEKTLTLSRLPDAPPLLTVKLDGYSTGINNIPDDYYNFLLASLCWFIELPAKENVLNNTAFYSNNAKAVRV